MPLKPAGSPDIKAAQAAAVADVDPVAIRMPESLLRQAERACAQFTALPCLLPSLAGARQLPTPDDMRILITGAAGRVGRATYIRLATDHELVGLDRIPSSTTDIVASIDDVDQLRQALRGVDVLIHIAAAHAPQVGYLDERTFEAVNVAATAALARFAVDAGVGSFVFTSTTALYGFASTAGDRAAWIDEDTRPLPRTIYHRTKLAAESLLERISLESGLPVTVIRMSRCFPEPAPIMAVHRLHRGVDLRDVADAHAIAAERRLPGFRRYLISGNSPFQPEDTPHLLENAAAVIDLRCPELAAAFRQRQWALPRVIDRVYSPLRAMQELGWRPQYGFNEVLAQLDRRSLEVLPPHRC